jgi:hypothetical protein
VKLREVPFSAFDGAHGTRFFETSDGVTVICQRTHRYGYHLSIAHPKRLPTWEEVRDIRYELVPDEAVMAMLLPPRADYVNVHDFCLQMIEVHDEHGTLGSRFTTRDDAP